MKMLKSLAVTAFMTTAAIIPANAQQADHHPAAAANDKVMPGGMSGMKGGPGMKMGKGGMMGKMGMMRKKMMAHHMTFTRAKPLSAVDVGRIVNGRLSMLGFTRLKSSNGKIKDKDIAMVDIVSPKGELISKLTVNRQTGMVNIVE